MLCCAAIACSLICPSPSEGVYSWAQFTKPQFGRAIVWEVRIQNAPKGTWILTSSDHWYGGFGSPYKTSILVRKDAYTLIEYARYREGERRILVWTWIPVHGYRCKCVWEGVFVIDDIIYDWKK